ncbi:MAG: TIR domain-containing protein [Pseudomonadaceae bacterium]|nr:TIR domain-containing protein [Pseudomonadaceae bacterium]
MPDTRPPTAYQGDDAFVFVSYAHADAERVTPLISALAEAGVNVWFDEGIVPGNQWTADLAAAIERCSAFLFLVSPNSVVSDHCVNEVHFAINRGKPFLASHLEPVEMPAHLELMIGQRQALMAYQQQPQEAQHKLASALQALLAGGSPRARSAPDEEASTSTAISAVSKRSSDSTGRVRMLTGAALLLLLALAVVWLRFGAGEPAVQGTIAVLPFNNYTPDDRSYISDGMADGLITQLAKLPNVRVASRASSFALKGELNDGALNMADIQRRLKVAHILEGSIGPGREEGGLLIDVRMVDAVSDNAVWSAQWDTSDLPITRIQSQISLGVARLLDPELSGANQLLMETAVTASEPAFDAYLLGRDLMRQPRSSTVIDKAQSAFERAIELDDDFAGAYAGLCETHLAEYSLLVEPISFALAQKACAQALERDPDLAEVRLSLGRLFRMSGDYEQSLTEIEEAFAGQDQSHELTQAYLERALTLDALGETVRAEADILEAINLEPGYWEGYFALANFYYDHAQYDKALAVYTEVEDLVTDDTALRHSIAGVQLAQGDFESALASYQYVAGQQEPIARATLSNIGTTYYYMGCFDEAAIFQRRAVDVAPNDHRVLGRLAESCRFVTGGEADARALWQRSVTLASVERNQSSWSNLGLKAVYLAHLGDADAAQRSIDAMWATQPVDAIAHFFTGIVQAKKGDEAGMQSSADQALASGFPQALFDTDPDFNEPNRCALAERMAGAAQACSVDSIDP